MRIGIVGISGYGGSELLRLCVSHPGFELAYAAGDSTAGQSLAQRFPALAGHPAGAIVIQRFEPEKVRGIDLLPSSPYIRTEFTAFLKSISEPAAF